MSARLVRLMDLPGGMLGHHLMPVPCMNRSIFPAPACFFLCNQVSDADCCAFGAPLCHARRCFSTPRRWYTLQLLSIPVRCSFQRHALHFAEEYCRYKRSVSSNALTRLAIIPEVSCSILEMHTQFCWKVKLQLRRLNDVLSRRPGEPFHN